MRPFEPAGSGGTASGGFTAVAGFAALDTVADLAVFLTEGKEQFYQALRRGLCLPEMDRMMSLRGPRACSGTRLCAMAAAINASISGRASMAADSRCTNRFCVPEPSRILCGSGKVAPR